MRPDSSYSRYLTPSSYIDRSCYVWQIALCALFGVGIGFAFYLAF